MHRKWWKRDSGPTDLYNGVLLCDRYHHQVHRDDWTIEIVDGQVWFVPPAHIDARRTPVRGNSAGPTAPIARSDASATE